MLLEINLIFLFFLHLSGAPHLNINLQMNYWPSLSCNLKECQEPLFDYISSLSITGKKTAKVKTPFLFSYLFILNFGSSYIEF